jgi:hypothetical protein
METFVNTYCTIYNLQIKNKITNINLIHSYKTYTRYFTSNNEPDGIENATHNTLAKQSWIWIMDGDNIQVCTVSVHFQFRRAHYHS